MIKWIKLSIIKGVKCLNLRNKAALVRLGFAGVI